MAQTFITNVFGENIIFFAEPGLSVADYRKKAINLYLSQRVVSPGTIIKTILKSYLNGDIDNKMVLDDASAFLDPEDLYDFRHLLCLVDSLTGLED